MKLKLLTMMIAMVMFSAITVKAQADESRIKVLNTEKPGVLKLVSAIQIEDGATINFFTDEGTLSTDEIKGSFPKGFAKRYDVRKVNKDFWIEVITPRLSVTYHIIPSKDGKTFTSNLEEAVHKYDVVVASRDQYYLDSWGLIRGLGHWVDWISAASHDVNNLIIGSGVELRKESETSEPFYLVIVNSDLVKPLQKKLLIKSSIRNFLPNSRLIIITDGSCYSLACELNAVYRD